MKHSANRVGRRRLIQWGSLWAAAFAGLGAQRGFTAQARQATARDAEGPFYVSNVPVVENLNRFGKTGEVMRITGRVMNAAAPDNGIPGAKLELWQTDGLGKYYPENNGAYTDYRDDEIDMRGTVICDSAGRFDVLSLFPAAYHPRPPHIHYWVHAQGFDSLVTQHYLDTDPGRRPDRTAAVQRDKQPALFEAPTLYLQPVG